MRPSCYLASLFILLAVNPLFSQGNRGCGGRETIRIFSGNANQITCAEDTTGVIEFRVSSFSTPFVTAVTDTDNIIQAISWNNKVNFSDLGPGGYRVYGLFFKGNLLAQPGMRIDTAALSDYCYGLSVNFVEINTQEPDAGMITDLDGLATRFICPDDQSDIIAFDRTGNGGEFTYVITDTNQVVVTTTRENSFDFSTIDLPESRVYGIAYIGNLLLQAGDTLTTTGLVADGCYDLSDNFLSVVQATPDAGITRLTNGNQSALLCPGAGDILSFEATGTSPTPFTFVLTDSQDVILDILDNNSTSFSERPAGTYKVYGISYTGNPSVNAGDTITTTNLSDDCFAISEAPVTITIEFVDGGQVSLQSGSRLTEVCVMDGESDELIFINNSTAADANYIYILTNEDNEVILPLFGDRIDFDVDLITGVNRVWGLSFTGEFTLSTGQDVTTTALSDACYDLSSTFVTIIKSLVIGGEVSLADSAVATSICPEGRPDTLTFLTSGSSTGTYGYVATATDGRILMFSDTSFMALGTLAVDTLDIYGLAYTGDFLANDGEIVTESILSNGCFALSQNAIRVTAERPENGLLTTIGGATDTLICPEGEIPLIELLAPDARGGDMIAILTDSAGLIKTLSTGLSVSFPTELGQGIYQLWSANYTGNLLINVGLSLAETPVSDDCFALSANPVTVEWESPFAGELVLADGTQKASFCPQNGIPDTLSWIAPDANEGNLVYLLTDTTNQILSVLAEAKIDGDTLPQGTYRIHGLAYTGSLLAAPGQVAGTVALSDGCFQLSTSFLSLDAIQPLGGEVSLSEGDAVFCSGDGRPDVLKFSVLGQESRAHFTFLVTDADDIFLFDLRDSSTYDFETVLGGNLKVYGLSYTGDLSVAAGDTVTTSALSTDCYSLSSNAVIVDRQEVDGGLISTLDGRTTAFVCAGDGSPDELQFTNTGLSAGSGYLYVITTNTDLVVAVLPGDTQDFENTGFNELRVWGVSYAGNLASTISGNIRDIVFSDACYELSANFITVVRDQPESSRISDLAGQTDVVFCPGPDGDTLQLFRTGSSSAGYLYLLLDQANTILQISEEDAFDMSDLSEGDYLIAGISYTGQVLVNPGDVIDPASTTITDNCFVVSDNIMTVRKGGQVNGGSLNTSSGNFTFYTCPGDTLGDAVVVLAPSDTLAAEYRIIITDENDRIVFPDVENPVIDFNRADPGIYRIYGVSYTGNFIPQFNQDLFGGDISSECYEPSSNFIEVFNFTPAESLVSTDDGLTEVTTISGTQDAITFTQQGGDQRLAYRYLITDLNNTVVSVLDDSVFVADTLNPGSYRVWGVNHTGELTAAPGTQADVEPLANNCFVLSANFVSLTIEGAQPGAVILPAAAQQIGLFPNPTIHHLSLRFDLKPEDIQDDVRLQVVNPGGTVVIDREIGAVNGKNQVELNVSKLDQGIYLVRLTNGKMLQQARFLKVNP